MMPKRMKKESIGGRFTPCTRKRRRPLIASASFSDSETSEGETSSCSKDELSDEEYTVACSSEEAVNSEEESGSGNLDDNPSAEHHSGKNVDCPSDGCEDTSSSASDQDASISDSSGTSVVDIAGAENKLVDAPAIDRNKMDGNINNDQEQVNEENERSSSSGGDIMYVEDDVDACVSSSEESDNDEINGIERDVWYDSVSEFTEDEGVEDMEESDDEEGETEESDDEEEEMQEGNQRLYPGAPLTLHESLLAILTVASVEHISGKLLARILQLIALHCPLNNNCKQTLYKFRKYFSLVGNKLVEFHYVCSNCVFPLQSKEAVCKKCKKAGNVSFFLEFPLLHQLQLLFQKPTFFNRLQGRFDPERKKNKDNVEDIYDGEIYRDQFENNGFLSNPNNISFTWYSDGVQPFKSSSHFSIWPLCLTINELKYREKILPRNILLVGLWFGPSKPNPNIFLKPLYRTMKAFTLTGYTLKLDDNSTILVKGKIICGTCDLPAKSKFLMFKQYNGEFGCAKCLQPGETIALGPRSAVRAFPYSRDLNLRVNDDVLTCYGRTGSSGKSK